MQVDEEWPVRTPTGFVWWADIEVLTMQVMTARQLALLNARVMSYARLPGPVNDVDSGTLSPCSLVLGPEGIASWMNPSSPLRSARGRGPSALHR